jgi:UDP-N-acetylmuramoyl-tripeptide--D-alanyl-D-alanine ligase
MGSGMSPWNAGQVASSTGGVLLAGAANLVFSGVSIDTRSLREGDLFFAIRGPNNDGHLYVMTALNNGAAGAVVDSNFAPSADFPAGKILIQVQDTHQALKDFAAETRRQWHGSLVAVTGSMGKTTSKEFAAQMLQIQFGVYRSPGNFNNLFGLPLALFGLTREVQIGIFEMGMSAPGEIAEMCRIARPDIGVITNVAPVHLEFFASLEAIAEAKGELAAGISPEGMLIFNNDDPLIRKIAGAYPGQTISFGFEDGADVRAADIEIAGLGETRFQIRHAGMSHNATIPLAGAHFVRNALPAVALAIHFKLTMEQVLERLRQLNQANMRGQVLHFRDGFTIIDDSYNSNPHALMQMTDTLCRVPAGSRRILVAGEMLELGAASAELHYRCGRWAAEQGVDIVIAVRGDAGELARGAKDAGLNPERVKFFESTEPAFEFLDGLVQSGDLILIKGSRGVHLEKIVQQLQKSRAEDRR